MNRPETLEARSRRQRPLRRAPLAAALLLVLAFGPLGCTSDEERATRFMEQGDAYAEQEPVSYTHLTLPTILRV